MKDSKIKNAKTAKPEKSSTRTFAEITEEEIKNAIMINEANGNNSDMITIDGLTMKVVNGDFAEYAKSQGEIPYKETRISTL